MNPRGINREAVADSAIKVIRVLSGRRFRGASVVRGLRCAHPRLSPFGFRLRGHAFQATWRRGEDVEELGLGVWPYALTHAAVMTSLADAAERGSTTSAEGA